MRDVRYEPQAGAPLGVADVQTFQQEMMNRRRDRVVTADQVPDSAEPSGFSFEED